MWPIKCKIAEEPVKFWSMAVVKHAKNTLDHFNIGYSSSFLSYSILQQNNFQSDHHNSESSAFITPQQANSQLAAIPNKKGS